jgi:excisionase family DNA binding protein
MGVSSHVRANRAIGRSEGFDSGAGKPEGLPENEVDDTGAASFPEPDRTDRRWLTLEDLMHKLPLKRSRIYYLVHTNQIPHHRIGRTLIFDYDEIIEWVRHDGKCSWISRKAG